MVAGGVEEKGTQEQENKVEEEVAVEGIDPRQLERLQLRLQEEQQSQEKSGHKCACGGIGERYHYEGDPSKNQPEPQPESEFRFVGVPDGIVDGLVPF